MKNEQYCWLADIFMQGFKCHKLGRTYNFTAEKKEAFDENLFVCNVKKTKYEASTRIVQPKHVS